MEFLSFTNHILQILLQSCAVEEQGNVTNHTGSLAKRNLKYVTDVTVNFLVVYPTFP